MKEIEQCKIRKVEKMLGIRFIEVNSEALENLTNNVNLLANKLGVPAYRLCVPKKGFLNQPLSPEQDVEISHLLGPHYAEAGVRLQDKLTNIKVEESGEKMVFIPALFNKNNIPLSISTNPFHEACGKWAGKQRVFWLRESVAIKLLNAGEALTSCGYMFHIEDAFRPVGVQEGLFLHQVKMILQQYPDWIDQWDKIWTEARSKIAISPLMAGHKSGAAIDLTLRTLGGIPLPLGNSYLESGPKVSLHYPYVTQEQWTTRQLFIATMEMSGLRVYPYENWHASFGDLSYGIKASSVSEVSSKYQAVFGPIKGFNEQTGEVEPYQEKEYYTPFFTKEELVKLVKSDK